MSPAPVNPADCLFCRIIRGDVPSTRVYEDADVLAFLDINPVAVGHTLIVPKMHCATLLDLPPELGEAVMRACRGVGQALMDGLGAAGFNCMQNNFAASGQMIFHVHWHIIPRAAGDGLTHWPQTVYADEGAMRCIAETLRQNFAKADSITAI